MKAGKNKKRAAALRPLSSWLILAAGVTAAGFGVTFACTRLPTAENTEPQSPSSAVQTVHSAKADEKNLLPPAQSTYADAIRRHDFARAAWMIDGASSDERKSPEVRYARARVALELGDAETALRQVDNLEKDWPLFAPEAESIRIAAATVSHDVTLLTHFLGKSTSLEEKLVLAEAHEKSSSLLEARQLADEVLSQLSGSKRRDRLHLIARARAVRARTFAAEDKKSAAANEYKWLAISAASLDSVSEWDARMFELAPELKLSAQERLSRAKTFSDQGWVKLCEDEVAALNKLSASTPPAAETDALVAWAVYTSRTDYLRAAQLFANAASHGGANRQKNLYYEAKALARSHRDADAIDKYVAVAKMGGEYADHAAYQAARLRFIDGQWKAAVSGYEAYLKRFGTRAKHRDGATYDLPIARLAAKDFKGAIPELQKLFAAEKNERERARLMQLQGVAFLGAGNKKSAAETFRQVIDFRPLSFPALLAAARLKQMGEVIPPLIPPAQSLDELPQPLTLSLPDKVWRLSRVGLDSEAESAMRQNESALRKKYGARGGEALCRIYGQLQSAQRRFQIAQSAASWRNLKLAPNAETEWEWDCIYPTPYQDVAEYEGALRNVPTAFIYSVMRQESAFRPTVVSPAAAVGLMQIIPPTAEKIAQEIGAEYDPALMRAPAVNIRFGTYYLRRLLDMFGDKPYLAAASYNAGPHAVTRWLRAGETLPLDIFVARIPYKETRGYVYRVMGNYARYAYRDDKTQLPEVELTLPVGLKATDDAY